MAVSIVQIGSNSNTGSTTLIGGFFSTPTKGNRLIAVVSAPVVTASLTGPSGWTIQGAGSDNTAANGSCTMWAKISDGTENSFFFSWSGAGNSAVITYEVKGLTVPNPGIITDRVVNASGFAVTTLTCTLASATRLPDELAICAVAGINTFGGLVSGPTGGFNDDTSSGSATGNFLWCSSKVLSATETSSSAITWTTSRNPAGLLKSFRGMSLDAPAPTSFIAQS
jgi:hypothetical protein